MSRAAVYILALSIVPGAQAYSVLTHEAIIDSAWEQNIKPVLLGRFPHATIADLTTAHAYAYAGCIIQDMGYYPFGSKYFSDLTHYVRSGDFVVTMIREADDLNEYAFGLGALAHYAADNEGHRIAVNPSVAVEFPKLASEYGPVVTYADNPIAHIKVEFGFDVLQVARGHYAPQAYHDFIGFRVSKPLLERAFLDTYGLQMKDLFFDLDLALGTYRRTVSKIIPEMTKVAWDLKKKDLLNAEPGLTRRRFMYNISRASFEKEWDHRYREPGVGAKLLAFFIRLIPKVGPFEAVAFKPPTGQTATLFEESFNRTLDLYRTLLMQVRRQTLALENRDFDTGQPTRPGEYQLADDTYAKLAVQLSGKNPDEIDPKIAANVLGYFRDLNRSYATKRKSEQWEKTVAALHRLEALSLRPASPAAPGTALVPAK